MFSEADVIHTYTRSQALEDGVLVDAASMAPSRHPKGIAAEARFKIPVALTQAVADLVRPTEEEETDHFQSVSGRLWDTLSMARMFAPAKAARDGEALFPISFAFAGRESEGIKNGQREMRMKLHVGPADMGEIVATIMLAHED